MSRRQCKLKSCGLFQPVREKPKRKMALDFVPQTAEQWAEYDAPDEVLDAFKTEQMRQIGINASSIPKPVRIYHELKFRPLK